MRWLIALVVLALIVELARLALIVVFVLAVLQVTRWLLVYNERAAIRRERERRYQYRQLPWQ